VAGPFGQLGRLLLVAGLVLAALGGLLLLAERLPWLRLGRLPGDIVLGREGFRLYLPIATSIVLSVIASFLLWLWSRRG